MALQVTNLTREFKNGKDKAILTDPNQDMSPAEVMKFYSSKYPELTNAKIEGPVIIGDKAVYNFTTQAGKLG